MKTSRNLLRETYFFAKIIAIQAKGQKDTTKPPKTKVK